MNIIPNSFQLPNLKQEQPSAENIREVFMWKSLCFPDQLPILLFLLQKYRKQCNLPLVEEHILYRFFYDDCGKVKNKHFYGPKKFQAAIFLS